MRPLTRSCFLLLVLGRLFLLALPVLLGICRRSLWSPPFFLHALPRIPLFLAKVRLSLTLTLSPLTILCFGQTALFLFLLEKTALAHLPTALSVALRPLFPFQQGQYAQVFLLKPAPFCTLLAGLGSTSKSATFLLLSDSRSVLSSIFPLYLKLCGRSGRNCLLSPVLSGCNGSPDTRFSWGTTGHFSWTLGNDAADELARRSALLALSAISYSLSPLISRICSSVFSNWRRTV